MSDIFDFLGLDLEAITKKLSDLKERAGDKYEDFVNNNVKKYDLSTNEGFENFIRDAADIRTKLLESDSTFANKYLVETLDSLVTKAVERHKNLTAEKETTPNKVNDLVHAEVVRDVKENHGKVNTGSCDKDTEEKKVFWPSDSLNYKQKRSIWRIVDEYMDNMVIPYLGEDYDEEMVDDMSSGLFEFAAWIMNKED